MHHRLFTLVFLLMISVRAPAETLTGRIVGVSDTLTLLDAKQVQHKIRIAGIDAPEKSSRLAKRPSPVCRRWRTTAPPKRIAARPTATGATSASFLSAARTSAWSRSKPGWPGGTGSTPRNRRNGSASITNTPSPWRTGIATDCGAVRIPRHRGNGGTIGGNADTAENRAALHCSVIGHNCH